MTIHDYVTQKDQFLLTILPFSMLLAKDRFCSNHFELCNIMRDGRIKTTYLVYNFEKEQKVLSKILSSRDISIKSQ